MTTGRTLPALGAALAIAAALGGCVVRYVVGPRLTGTCDGACEHYVDCSDRADQGGALRQACLAECPGVFADHESIMAFESLSCSDTVEFVEGSGHRPPGVAAPPPFAAASSAD